MNHTDLYKDPTKIDWRTPVVIDFETYYDKDYSLKKITSEEYIRCDKFECIGVAVKIGNMPTNFYKKETGIEIIRHIVTTTYPNSPVIFQHATFDAGILAFRYDIHPNFIVDTMVMAKLSAFDRVAGGTSLAKMSAQLEKMGIYSQVKGTTVHNMLGVHAADMTAQQWQEYGDYCKLDVDLTHALYTYLIDKVPTSELIMADITTKMFTKPMVDLDVPLLEQYAVRLETEREQMLSRISGDLGFTDTDDLLKNLRSSKKFVTILERLGVETPMKWSEKQEKMIPAVSKTDTEFLALLEHDNELVRTLVETKLGTMSSMEQTRTATFLDIASRGRMPIPLRYASAHTGRYGGCFVAETKIWVRKAITTLSVFVGEHDHIPSLVNIADVGKNDLVWNGDTFCSHGGVVCNGVQPVISYCGLVGTYGHQVFVEGRDDTVSLGYAKEHNLQLVYAHTPHYDHYNTSWEYRFNPSYKSDEPIDEVIRRLMDSEIIYPDTVCVPVYDIVNVGDTHRYVANGYLVHNSDKVNPQNLSKRTKDPVLRRSLRAMDGHVVIATDSTQVELRVNSLIADQQDAIDVFTAGRDPYVDMATAIFNRPYDEIYHEAKVVGSKEGKRMRNLGKEVCLAGGFGMSANTFRERMILAGQAEAAQMADDLITAYRAKNYKIVQFWRECDHVLKVMYAGGSCWFGGANNNLFYADGSSEFHGVKIPSIRFPNGTYLFYQNLRLEIGDNGREQLVYDQFKGRGFQPTRVWGSLCDENLTQKLAFDILKYQAIEIAKAGVPINLNVHDEWVSVVPREQASQAVVVHYVAMKSVPDYIPQGLLDCEVDVGLNYADLKTVDVKKFLVGATS